ncbi:Sulfotransferase family protein [Microbulbifer donghaiensis]|uniref:Sulfotransferase family protein n=1 Tax=Microbulbifer donghaiensis TaxID=494016 RepID=A0A1M5IBF1_9GAMM|nr:sulfotransferase family 2 domain-containing protein [Microbulbifer donghaiensis]SHG25626.1 Sulfotransferase family protein [Microbulbifer donghaiensis]
MNKLIKLAKGALARAPFNDHLARPGSSKAPPRIYFCHIPKSAGSSIASAIRDQVYSRHNLDGFNIDPRASLRAGKVTENSLMQAREVILAYNLSVKANFFGKGHCYCRPGLIKEFASQWNFITVLRNPIDRWISEYVYNTYKQGDWTKNDLPLNEYLESRKAEAGGQQLIRYFSNYSLNFRSSPRDHIDEALENLSRFAIVGTMENLDTWADELMKKFSFEIKLPSINKSPSNQAVEQIRSNPAVMRKIEDLCRHDLELYDKFTAKHGNLYSNPSIDPGKASA